MLSALGLQRGVKTESDEVETPINGGSEQSLTHSFSSSTGTTMASVTNNSASSDPVYEFAARPEDDEWRPSLTITLETLAVRLTVMQPRSQTTAAKTPVYAYDIETRVDGTKIRFVDRHVAIRFLVGTSMQSLETEPVSDSPCTFNVGLEGSSLCGLAPELANVHRLEALDDIVSLIDATITRHLSWTSIRHGKRPRT